MVFWQSFQMDLFDHPGRLECNHIITISPYFCDYLSAKPKGQSVDDNVIRGYNL